MEWSITKKLVLAFLAVGLIPLISAEILSTSILKEELEGAIEKTVEHVVEEAEDTLFAYEDSVRETTADFSRDPFIREQLAALEAGDNASAENLSEYLYRNNKPLAPSLEGIMLIDREGMVVAATDGREIGKNVSAEDFFKNGRSATFMSGFGRHGFFGDKEAFVVVAPVTDEVSGEPLGVIANVFDTEDLAGRLSEVHREGFEEVISPRDIPAQSVYIVDRNGNIVVPGDNGTSDSEPVRACFEDGEEFMGRYTNHLGTEVIGTGGCFPSRGLAVIAEIDAAEANRGIERAYVLLGYITLFFAASVILVGLILSSSISRPVKELTEAIDRISRGEMEADVPAELKQGGDELGSLAQAFDRTVVSLKMAIRHSAPEMVKDKERLRSALEETEKTKETLSLILDNVGDGLVLLDEKGVVVRANMAITRLWGFTPEEVEGRRLDSLRMFSPGSLARLLDAFSRRMKGENVPPYEVEIFRNGGGVSYAELRASVIVKDGSPKGEVMVLRDITEARRLGKALGGRPKERGGGKKRKR